MHGGPGARVRRAAIASGAFAWVTLAVVTFGGCQSAEPSLGARVPATVPTSTTPRESPSAPLGTLADLGALEVDAERLLTDPCKVLTVELRAEVDATGEPHRDDGRCEMDADDGVLVVEVLRQPAGLIATSYALQQEYGEALVPLPQDPLGFAYEMPQGRTTFVAVLTDEVSISFNLPVRELTSAVMAMLERACTEA